MSKSPQKYLKGKAMLRSGWGVPESGYLMSCSKCSLWAQTRNKGASIKTSAGEITWGRERAWTGSNGQWECSRMWECEWDTEAVKLLHASSLETISSQQGSTQSPPFQTHWGHGNLYAEQVHVTFYRATLFWATDKHRIARSQVCKVSLVAAQFMLC